MEGVAFFAHEVLGWRKTSTRERIAQVCKDRSPAEQTWIRRESVRNLARNITELMRPDRHKLKDHSDYNTTFDAFHQARKRGKGILLVIAHTGNWDLGGFLTAEAGFPMCFIARHQKNSHAYQELIRAREAGGGSVVDRDDPKLIRKLLAFLADNGIVAILIDIRSRQPGDCYQFLGENAWVSNGLGLLAAKSGAEVVPVYLGREGRSKHICKPLPSRRLEPEATGKAERNQLLQSCLDDLSAEILQNPQSYFWFNKRWVLEPF
jgi:KDO2-lipid IV(A) lauroyltransferase